MPAFLSSKNLTASLQACSAVVCQLYLKCSKHAELTRHGQQTHLFSVEHVVIDVTDTRTDRQTDKQTDRQEHATL